MTSSDNSDWSLGVHVAEQEVQFAVQTLNVQIRRELKASNSAKKAERNNGFSPEKSSKFQENSTPTSCKREQTVSALRRKFDDHNN